MQETIDGGRMEGLRCFLDRSGQWLAHKTRSLPGSGIVKSFLRNRRYLRTVKEPIRLHLGCGSKHLHGYINMDVEDWAGTCDMIASAVRLPMFADNSVEEVFSHALLEHLPPWETMPALREWHRVLKAGGRVQIETPDLERIFEDWLVKKTLSEQEAINIIFGGNKRPNKKYAAQDHLTGFTYDRLTRMMAEAGFTAFRRLEHQAYHHILVVEVLKAPQLVPKDGLEYGR